MAEPRKITIKIRKPGAPGATPAPAAAAPAAPAAAPAPAPAPAPEPAPAPAPAAAEPAMTPIPETPAAPVAEAAPAPAPAPEAAPEAAQQAKRQTSRIELPPEISQPPVMPASEETTIKLKPVSQSAVPESPEAAQATKSKTARIALDSVLGGIQSDTPMGNTTQKTIKLKRATPAPGGTKPLTSTPIKPLGAAAGEEKTVKLKRPGLVIPKKDAPKPAEPELEQLESLDDDLAPLPELTTLAPAQESAGAKAFTVIGIIAAALAIIATVALCILLQKQAASPNGDLPTGNTLHSLPFQRF